MSQDELQAKLRQIDEAMNSVNETDQIAALQTIVDPQDGLGCEGCE